MKLLYPRFMPLYDPIPIEAVERKATTAVGESEGKRVATRAVKAAGFAVRMMPHMTMTTWDHAISMRLRKAKAGGEEG